MASNEGENANVGVNEWEVVSLTASAYAAAPGPVKVKDSDEGALDASSEDGAETSKALFMSRHFMDPLEHGNPAFVPLDSSILGKDGGKHDSAEFLSAEGKSSGKDDTDWALKDLSVPDEFSGMNLSDEKIAELSIHGTEFKEESNLQGLGLVNKDSSLYSAAAASYSSLQSETVHVIPTNYVDNVTTFENSSEHGLDLCADQSPKSKKIDKMYEPDSDSDSDSGLPWWKRRAASLYAQVKAANAFWTVFVAGAVVGIVILQQRWQQEKRQVLQLRWHVTHSMMSDSVGGVEK